MRQITRYLAAAIAGVLLTTGVSGGFPKSEQNALAETDALTDFMHQLAAIRQEQPEERSTFCTLRYSEQDQMLYRDGTAVGTSFGGFQIVNGKLMAESGDGKLIPAEKAVRQAGGELVRSGSDLTVRAPFQTARLIVKSDSEPETYGAIQTASGYRGLHVMQYATPESAYQAYRQLQKNPAVIYVDTDRIYHAAGYPSRSSADEISPLEVSWGVADIGADQYCTWLKTEKKKLPEIRIALIDTGVYTEHKWLENRICDGGAGFIMDSDGTYGDVYGHGTHCAGIIASSTTDNVKIIPLKALDDDGYGESIEIYCAMMYAAEIGADVVSMSLGGEGESPLLDEASEYLAKADIPNCVAAGNESDDVKYHHPANAECNISIGAINSNHELAEFSNYGMGIDFVAPGVSINSSVPDSPTATDSWDGTSMATPFAAAAVANLLSYQPDLTTEEIVALLRANADDLGAAGFDEAFGWGKISLANFRFSSIYCTPPAVSQPSGDYDEPIEAELSCNTEGAEIYYTLDGSTPDPATAVHYTGPFMISESAKLRAVAVLDDFVSKELYAAYCINGKDIPNPFRLSKGVLTEYRGILKSLDLSKITKTKTITAVGEGAFANHSDLYSVTLPKTVTSIGDRAFYGCKELETLNAPGVRTVGTEALRGCRQLYYLEMSGLTEIGPGAFRDCASLVKASELLSDEITEIPDYAFAGCDSLYTLDLGRVEAFGEGAFSNCGGLYSFGSGFDWSTVKKIGSYALQNTSLNGSVNLSSIESLGESAFAMCNISELILPESVTEIPEKLAKYTSSLRSVTAPGVTKIGAEAFSHSYSFRLDLYMDFAKITEIEEGALSYIEFPEPVCFENLTVLETDAFSYTSGESLSFPAVRTVKSGAIRECSVSVLYFEGLEALETNAVTGNCGVTVGDKLQSVAENALTVDYLAGPADSVLRQYADNNDIRYFTTPYMIASEAELSVLQGEPAQITAFALGFGDLRIRWYSLNGDEATEIPDADSSILVINSIVPGTYLFRAEMLKDGNLLTSADYQVTVCENEDFKEPTPLTPEKMLILSTDDFEEIVDEWAEYEDGDAYYYRKAYFSFTAEKTGVMTLYLSNAALNVSVLGNDNSEQEFYSEGEITTDTSYRFTVRNGVTYYLTLDCDWNCNSEDFEMQYISMLLSEKQDLRSISDCDLFCEFEGDTTFIYSGNEIKPKFSSLLLIAEDGTTEFTEDDVCIRYTHNNSIGEGTILLFGAKDCWGHRSVTFDIQGVLETEKETIIRNLSYDQINTLIFTPESDGMYTICTDISEDALRDEIEFNHYCEDFWNYVVNLNVLDANRDSMGESYSGYAGCILPAVSVRLREGETYQIELSNYDFSTISELAVTVHKDKTALDCHSFTQSDKAFCVLSDETVAPEITSSNPEYTPDDYTVQYLFADHAGTAVSLVRGCGAYCGTCFFTTPIYGVLRCGVELSEAAIGEEQQYMCQFIPEKNGSYVFYTDFRNETVQEDIASGQFDENYYSYSATDTYIELYDSEFIEIESNDDIPSNDLPFSSITAELKAGTPVYIQVTSHADEQELKRMTLNAVYNSVMIGEADIYMQREFDYYDEPVIPEPELWYEDELLEEGTDYTIECFANTEPGTMCTVITGIGRYCGRVYLMSHISEPSEIFFVFLDDPFLFTKPSQDFHLTIFGQTEICLTADDGLSPEYSAYVTSEDDGTEYYFEENMLTLPEGAYILHLSQEGSLTRRMILSEISSDTPISWCLVNIESQFEDGSVLIPQVTAFDNEKKLTEGEDYLVEYPDDITEVGSYPVKISGIGKYSGEMTVDFIVLPNKDTELPVIQEGMNNAEITAPGQSVYFTWEPKENNYSFRSEELRHKNIQVIDPLNGVVSSTKGVGMQEFSFYPEEGKQYYVLVSFTSPEETGTIPLSVVSDYRAIYDCDIRKNDLVPYRPGGNSVPDYELYYGTELLQEGTDYRVMYVGGEKHCGNGTVVLEGIGKYRDSVSFDYYVYPEDLSAFMDEEQLEDIPLELDEEFCQECGRPGNSAVYSFTSPFDEETVFHLDYETSYCYTVFVYGEDGTLLPQGQHYVTMKPGETVRILYVTTWLENSYNAGCEYTICVTLDEGISYFYDETTGISYKREQDYAYITGFDPIDPNAGGIELYDTVYDMETNTELLLRGFDETFDDYSLYSYTIYTLRDSFTWNMLQERGYCVAAPDFISSLSGDVTGDYFVTLDDALTLQRWLTEAHGMQMCDAAYRAADFNQDGSVDLLDVRAMLIYTTAHAVG